MNGGTVITPGDRNERPSSVCELRPFKTRLYLVIHEEEAIHPDIVRDDVAAVLDAAGFHFTAEAEDGND